MSEFNIGQWSDLVRGVADPEMADQMQEHLQESASARGTVAALRRVAAVGRSDHDSPVPAGAVRIAKAIGSTSRAGAVPKVRRIPFMVTFDSLLEAAPAGSRGAQQSHRELTFEAQGYSIDLRLEHETAPSSEGFLGTLPARQVVVGQLLKRDGDDHPTDPCGDGARPVSRAPVFVFSGEHLIGKAVTGNHGEFQVEGLPRESLDLCLVAGEDYLEMPLAAKASFTDDGEENAP